MNYKILLVLFTILILSQAYAEIGLSYLIKLNYENSKLSLLEIRLIEGDAPERFDQPDAGYVLKIISFNGNTLYSLKFPVDMRPLTAPPRDIFDEAGNQIKIPEYGYRVPKNATFTLIVPYHQTAESIDIYDGDTNHILSIDVSEYSKMKPPADNKDASIIMALFGIAAICFVLIRRKSKKN